MDERHRAPDLPVLKRADLRGDRAEIRYAPVPVDAYTAAMAEQGVPQEVTDLLGYLFSEVLDGRNAHLADGVQRALGRPPRDFADYARETAATGVWDGIPVTS